MQHATKDSIALLKMIKKRADFLNIQQSGKKWVSHGLILQFKENDLGDQIRIGFTVSKRVDKSAVKRNRIKRRLRAVASDILPLYAKAGMDYVLVGKSIGATRAYDDLCNDLKWCLKKTGCRRDYEEAADGSS